MDAETGTLSVLSISDTEYQSPLQCSTFIGELLQHNRHPVARGVLF